MTGDGPGVWRGSTSFAMPELTPAQKAELAGRSVAERVMKDEIRKLEGQVLSPELAGQMALGAREVVDAAKLAVMICPPNEASPESWQAGFVVGRITFVPPLFRVSAQDLTDAERQVLATPPMPMPVLEVRGRQDPEAFLRGALASLPALVVNPVPIGFAISSSAFLKRDGDRCIAYVVPSPAGWGVQDSGDTFSTMEDVERAERWAVETGAAVTDWTIQFPSASPEAAAVNVALLLGLLWRIARVLE